jgi:Flp pilus assembly protein TadB
MPAPFPPDPHDHHRGLSAHEADALARIERELAGGDPGFGQRMRRRDEFVPVELPSARTALLVAVLALVLSLVVGAPASWWALIAVLVVLCGVPWMALRLLRRGSHEESGRP